MTIRRNQAIEQAIGERGRFSISYYFFVTFFEWFEFSVYNTLAPHLSRIIVTDNAYIANLTILVSFLFRPMGAIFFSRIIDRQKALKISLWLMTIATTLLAFTPKKGAEWMLICKCVQGFALGGSYGISYFEAFDREEESVNKRTNYKVALLQCGWVVGCIAGRFVVCLFEKLFGNLGKIFTARHGSLMDKVAIIGALEPSEAFFTFGWRLCFLLSAVLGSLLLIRRVKSNSITAVHTPVQLQKRVPLYLMVTVFFLSCIEFVIFYTNIFVQMQPVLVLQEQEHKAWLALLQQLLMLLLFPTFGFLLDKTNNQFKRNYNIPLLFAVMVGFIAYSTFCLEVSLRAYFFAAILLSACYTCLLPAIIKLTPKHYRYIIGPIINLGSIVGGGVQFSARIWFDTYGAHNLYLFTIVASILPTLGLLMATRLRRQ